MKYPLKYRFNKTSSDQRNMSNIHRFLLVSHSTQNLDHSMKAGEESRRLHVTITDLQHEVCHMLIVKVPRRTKTNVVPHISNMSHTQMYMWRSWQREDDLQLHSVLLLITISDSSWWCWSVLHWCSVGPPGGQLVELHHVMCDVSDTDWVFASDQITSGSQTHVWTCG